MVIEKIFSAEQIRLVFVAAVAPILAAITPTQNFVIALVIMCGFNIWCGMRADGVVINTCKNFSKKKFRGALVELLLYIAILWFIHIIMFLCGDKEQALYAAKTLTYIFFFVYLQHSFRNLTIAYPTNKAIWMIYLAIRLEFKRLMPSNLFPLLEQYEQKIENEKANTRENSPA